MSGESQFELIGRSVRRTPDIRTQLYRPLNLGHRNREFTVFPRLLGLALFGHGVGRYVSLNISRPVELLHFTHS
jgi:hypothetical protein